MILKIYKTKRYKTLKENNSNKNNMAMAAYFLRAWTTNT
jgi:hypothetical protein